MAQRTIGGLDKPTYDDLFADAEGLGLDVNRGMTYKEVRELLDQYGDELSGTVYDPRKKDPFAAPRRKPAEPSAPVVVDPFDDSPAPVRASATVPLPEWITDRQGEPGGEPAAADAD